MLVAAYGGLVSGATPTADSGESPCAQRPGKPGYSGMRGLLDVEGGERRVRLFGVTPGSPAADAGLVAGDVVVAIDGLPATFRSEYEWGYTLGAYRPGDVVSLAVLRGGARRNVSLKMSEPTPDWKHQFVHWLLHRELEASAANQSLLGRRSVDGPVEVSLRLDASCRLQGEVAGRPADHPLGLAAALRIVPLMDRLSPGDTLTFRVRFSGGVLSIDPIIFPPYIRERDFTRAIQETVKRRNDHAH